MADVQHTPGPYEARTFAVYAGREQIAHTGLGQLPARRSHESEANANRIALALNCHEELLAALRKVEPLGDASLAADIRKALRPHELAAFDEIITTVRAAIAKAEGR